MLATPGLFDAFHIAALRPGSRLALLADAGARRQLVQRLRDYLDAHPADLAISVFARGLLRRVATRLYFADEAALNAIDPGLGAVADPAARATLIAARTEAGYRLDIRLQGDGETVFFDV